ncbi:MAG: hypothetical protein LUG52_07850 [Clostridia bacterium]|nr:hypothetical protein [Clostridia bacterium]
MAYKKHEMSVMLFSKKDDVFTDDDVDITSGNDNEWDDSKGSYSGKDDPDGSFDW